MTASRSQPLITPFVWWFAGASGVAGVAAFICAMNEDDWHWLGFVIPVWIVFFAVCAQGGLLVSLLVKVSVNAMLMQSRGNFRDRRKLAVPLVFVISAVVSAAVVSVWVAYRQGGPWLEIVVIPICFGVTAALLWSLDTRALSNGAPAVSELSVQRHP